MLIASSRDERNRTLTTILVVLVGAIRSFNTLGFDDTLRIQTLTAYHAGLIYSYRDVCCDCDEGKAVVEKKTAGSVIRRSLFCTNHTQFSLERAWTSRLWFTCARFSASRCLDSACLLRIVATKHITPSLSQPFIMINEEHQIFVLRSKNKHNVQFMLHPSQRSLWFRACFVSLGTPTRNGKPRAFNRLNGHPIYPPRGL